MKVALQKIIKTAAVECVWSHAYRFPLFSTISFLSLFITLQTQKEQLISKEVQRYLNTHKTLYPL